MAKRLIRTTAIVAATAVLAVACGRDSQSDVSTEPESTNPSTTQEDPTVTPDQPEEAQAPTSTDEPAPTTETDPPDDATTPTPSPEPSAESGGSTDDDSREEPATGTGPIDEGLRPFIDDAVAQLAADLPTSVTQITVQSARLVQWSDSSLGCPEKGMEYAQAVVDGSVIELIVDAKSYWYHTGGTRTPFLCTSPLRVST